jgi:hypothetical protein
MDVAFKYFMLHVFDLFTESRGAGSNGGTTRALGNDGARRTSVLRTGHAESLRSGRDVAGVCVQDEANDLESRRTGRATRARRVVWTHGRCDRMGARAGRESISAWGQVARASRCVLMPDGRALVAPF